MEEVEKLKAESHPEPTRLTYDRMIQDVSSVYNAEELSDMPRKCDLRTGIPNFLVITLSKVAILASLPIVGLCSYLLYLDMIPLYSCEAAFPELDMKLKLSLYLTGHGNQDTGEYLSIYTNDGHATKMLDGIDWAHFLRINIYQMRDGDIGVLDFSSSGFRITLKPLAISGYDSAMTDHWRYLGAFVLGHTSHDERALVYLLESQLPECIVMAEQKAEGWNVLPRLSYRQDRCPDPWL